MTTDICNRCVIRDLCDVKDIVAAPPRCQNFVARPKTHFDQLRAMSMEEMADYFSELSCWPHASREVCMGMANCMGCWLKWLNEEMKE